MNNGGVELSIKKDVKSGLIKEYKLHEKDTGSPEVQVALLTGRIMEFLKAPPQLSAIPTDTPATALRVRHGGYDVRAAQADANVVQSPFNTRIIKLQITYVSKYLVGFGQQRLPSLELSC